MQMEETELEGILFSAKTTIKEAAVRLQHEADNEQEDAFCRGTDLVGTTVKGYDGTSNWINGEVGGFDKARGIYKLHWHQSPDLGSRCSNDQVNFFCLNPLLVSPPLSKKQVQEVHGEHKDIKEAIQTYYHRYDLDQSGTINSNVEFQQLCINLCFHMGLSLSLMEIEDKVKTAGDMDTQCWNFDEFYTWFELNFQEAFILQSIRGKKVTQRKLKKESTRNLLSNSIRRAGH